MISERGSEAGLFWEREMLGWGGAILPRMLAACPDGITLGPLVNTVKQSVGARRWVPLRAGVAETGRGGARAGCINCLQDDMAVEKQKRVH